MRQKEKGFTTIELIVALVIIALIGGAAMTTIFQIIHSDKLNNNQMEAVRQVQNAGYWISRDTRTADSIVTDNLSATDFVILSWTERDYESDDVYHSVTYFFEDLSEGVGKLMRNHWSSTGINRDTLVAEHISYDPSDPANTSNISYQNPVLAVKLTALCEDVSKTREYRISRRSNFN